MWFFIVRRAISTAGYEALHMGQFIFITANDFGMEQTRDLFVKDQTLCERVTQQKTSGADGCAYAWRKCKR